jgi:hypothetical protein
VVPKMTPVQQGEVSEPRAGAGCTSIRAGHRSGWHRRWKWESEYRYLLIAMDYLNQVSGHVRHPQSRSICSDECSAVTNFCRFGVPKELLSHQGQNIAFRLL